MHPVAVTLARVAHLPAVGVDRLPHPDRPPFSVPVHLGDSMQWGHRLTVDVLRDNADEVLASLGPRVYTSDPTGGRRAVLGCLRDRQTWRDMLWLAIHVWLTCFVVLVYIPVALTPTPDPAVLWVGVMYTGVAVWIMPGFVQFPALTATVLSPRAPSRPGVGAAVSRRHP